MHFVLLAEHSPENCPTSNAKIRALVKETGPATSKVAERNGVSIVAGPLVSREHLTVVVVKTERAADLDRFLAESRLAQWNSVRVVPSVPVDEMDFDSEPTLF